MNITSDWIVGFVDGDGHFGFGKTSCNSDRFYFVISQNKRSVSVLYEIKKFFQCGLVQKSGKDMMEYKVTNKKHLIEIIIPFFQTHPLKTSKAKSFNIFVEKITDKSKSALFLQKSEKPIENQNLILINTEWLLGFLDAEASFVCSIINKTIRPQMIIGLHSQDNEILDIIQKFLKRGRRYKKKNDVEIFQLSSNRDMLYLVQNFLLTNGYKDRLRTHKRIRARKWSRIILLMAEKKHKTLEGFEKIQKLYKTF